MSGNSSKASSCWPPKATSNAKQRGQLTSQHIRHLCSISRHLSLIVALCLCRGIPVLDVERSHISFAFPLFWPRESVLLLFYWFTTNLFFFPQERHVIPVFKSEGILLKTTICKLTRQCHSVFCIYICMKHIVKTKLFPGEGQRSKCNVCSTRVRRHIVKVNFPLIFAVLAAVQLGDPVPLGRT